MNEASTPNPFPRGTVVTDTGARSANFRGNSWDEAGKLIAVYRENYFSRDAVQGLVMGIRGRFGSGKTHLVFQLRDDFAKEPLVTRTVYAKLDHPNFLDLYRSGFAPAIVEQLGAVVARHLAKLLRVQTVAAESGAETLPNIAQRVVDEALVSNPERVLELVEQDLLPVGGLAHIMDNEVEDASSDLTRDFFRAYTRLRDPSWSKIAIRWFEGDELTPEERDDLGLHTLQIAQPDQARKAMRFLLEIHRKADVPLLLSIDEFERFAVRGSSEDRRSFPGFLKDLAEMFETTGNAFLLCGAEDAWRQLTTDTFDRIKRDRIVEVKLTDAESESLLSVYCKNSSLNLTEVFDTGVVKFLTDLSERNARRLLNISYEAFNLTGGGRKISQQDVRTAAAKALADDQRFLSMDETVRLVARTNSLAVTAKATVGDATVDYALNENGERPIFLLVMRSSFKTDEVGAGRVVVTTLTGIRKERPRARTAVIVLGYSTDEVRGQVKRVSDEVLVYDEDRFETQLADFVRTAPQPQAASVEAQHALIAQVTERLSEIDHKRGDDYSNLAKQIQAMEEALRMKSTREREDRVTDKIGDAIGELRKLLQEEEELTIQGLEVSLPGSPNLNRSRVLPLIDQERAVLSRLELLNDGLPESSTLRPLLIAMNREADNWESKLGDKLFDPSNDVGGVRELYRARRQTLRAFELRHQRRVRRELDLLGWRVSSRYLALALFAFAGVAFDIYILTTGISANGKIMADYYSSVVVARSELSAIQASPHTAGSGILATVRGALDRGFLTARAEGLPVSSLNAANKDLIDSIDRARNTDFPSQYVGNGLTAADQLLASKPSIFWVTVRASWVWLLIGLIPAALGFSWWFANHLP